MTECPACRTIQPEGSDACGRCGLSSELFDPIRLAAGAPGSAPAHAAQIGELLEALGGLAQAPPARPAEIAHPARFPSLPSAPLEPAEEGSALELPKPPSRAEDADALRRRIADYLEIGRRQGVDLSELEERSRALRGPGPLLELERLARDLFVVVAASLTDTYETALASRRLLLSLFPVPEGRPELDAARRSLASGELVPAERSLRAAVEQLDTLEQAWGPVDVLLTNGTTLAESIRSLGGDPGPALGPFREGRRLAAVRSRAEAESILARGTLGLWTILGPLLASDLARRAAEVTRRGDAGEEVRQIVLDMQELAARLRQRNFAGAMESYEKVVLALDPVVPAAPAPPDRGAVKSGPPV